MKSIGLVAAAGVIAALAAPLHSQDGSRPTIGPAMTSGRVMTIAVDPSNTAVIHIGAASGGVWKTVNDAIVRALVNTPSAPRAGAFPSR